MSLAEIRRRIQKACEKSGRNEADVSLLAVSKLQSEEKIRGLAAEGQKDFGENYVQELTGKIENLKSLNLRWHLIGHLQRNKVKFITGRCHLIHSVDSLALAREIHKKALEKSVTENVLLQVNLGGENSKDGFSESALAEAWSDLAALSQLRIHGLMTMPPLQNEPEQNRVFFSKLRSLKDHYRSLADSNRHPLSELSMGTSHDFEVAVEEGATWIRVGTLAFGERLRKG
ncbi:MAG TPA: YggS family pyridoxal phosphate-dependent enzyme [Pseudobdellovibrionaceae bacterium]|nr:YggS family pyridoxal phosphate-dependent enzyme [Pseudobdellovibrionaceae bacterium]